MLRQVFEASSGSMLRASINGWTSFPRISAPSITDGSTLFPASRLGPEVDSSMPRVLAGAECLLWRFGGGAGGGFGLGPRSGALGRLPPK